MTDAPWSEADELIAAARKHRDEAKAAYERAVAEACAAHMRLVDAEIECRKLELQARMFRLPVRPRIRLVEGDER